MARASVSTAGVRGFAAAGDKFPAIELDFGFPPTKVNMAERLAGKKAVVVGVPGAFTPTCSGTHVPGYLAKQAALKAKGVSEVIVCSVNDGAVMEGWAKDQKVEGSMITFLGDTRMELTKALDLVLDAEKPMEVLGNPRCKRFAMVVDNGIIKDIVVAGGDVKIMTDGKLRAQQMSRLFPDGDSAPSRGAEPAEPAELSELEDDVVQEMAEYLADCGNGQDYGKFTNQFPRVKKRKIERHFDIITDEGGRQRVVLPPDHPQRVEEPLPDSLVGEAEAKEEERREDDIPEDDLPDEAEESRPDGMMVDPNEPAIPLGPGVQPAGVIRDYDPVKGFGFIRCEQNPEDIFFPRTALPKSFQGSDDKEMPVLKGVQVTFELNESNSRGPRTDSVTLLLRWLQPDRCWLLKRVLRVNQLDARRLDGEITSILRQQLLEATTATSQWSLEPFVPELDLLLGATLWRYTVWINEPTPGGRLQNVRHARLSAEGLCVTVLQWRIRECELAQTM
eukprot:s4378_g1.t1